MSAQEHEPQLARVTLVLCSLCLAGEGGECHVPGCALWMNRAPDLPLTAHCETITMLDGETLKDRGGEPSAPTTDGESAGAAHATTEPADPGSDSGGRRLPEYPLSPLASRRATE